MAKLGYEYTLIDEGNMDTVIAVSGSDVRYSFSPDYRNAYKTFEEFWEQAIEDIEEDIAENGLEESYDV